MVKEENQPKDNETQVMDKEQQQQQRLKISEPKKPRKGSRNWWNIPPFAYDETKLPWNYVDMNPPSVHVIRRSERLMFKDPSKFVVYAEDPNARAQPKKARKRTQKQARLPDPKLMCPMMKEFFYPTTPHPELTPEEKAKGLDELFSRPIDLEAICGVYEAPEPSEPFIPSRYPLLLEINDATAEAAGWPPHKVMNSGTLMS